MVSLAARRFMAMKIRKNIREGRSPKQSVAVAYSQARAKGFQVPVRAHMRRI